MDEDAGARAPVTRRRGRISVEVSDEGKPSTAPGTPTKKRGRKPAKPELALINENVVEENVKTTKKTVVKEIKDIEDKPVTPSRRSARIKSNTSIVSDTVQTFDSPRAKRAARRTSQAGSDNEIPLTPIRQTRRTRRDSTSSIEKQDAVTSDVKPTTKIPEPISEEPENTTKVINGEVRTSDDKNSKQSPIRRRNSIIHTKKTVSNTPEKDDKNNGLDNNNDKTSQTKKDESEDNKVLSSVGSETTNESKETPDNTTMKQPSETDKLSTSSANLIRDLDINPPKMSHANKSMSEAQTDKLKSKRQRTKSWTTMTAPTMTNYDFYSDNEKTRKLLLSKCYVVLDNMNKSGSGDCKLDSSSVDKHNAVTCVSEKNSSTNKSSVINKEISNNLDSNDVTELDSGTTNLFKSDPSNSIQAVVLLEDSDSNYKQTNTQKEDANKDQCLQVVDHVLEEKKRNDEPDHALTAPLVKATTESIFEHAKSFELKQPANDSCEPMDVDETLPEILTNNLSNKEMESKEKSRSPETALNESLNKSPTTFSMRLSSCENMDKTGNENKTTLILSQLKDSISENKSPQVLSKSVNVSNVAVPPTEINKGLSKTYLTSTPLQKKNTEKQDEKISNIFDNNASKTKIKITPKKNVSAITNSQSSDADSSADKLSDAGDMESLLDNEALEASDSYMSGDSRDEEENQYEKENEVVEKGETLTSEEEFSNDSDYEKDSFLVSSNEEDNELLSGSIDDLSMSDNELKMTSKSKKKYNERKLKQQKQASREMFQSRHKLSDSKKGAKLKLQSSESSDSLESGDNVVGPRNNKRNRLVSVNESRSKSDFEDSILIKAQQKDKKSSEKTVLTENEITISEETSKETHDPLATQVKVESKTPVKDTDISIGFVNADSVINTPCQKNTSKSKNPLDDSDDDSSSLSNEDINIAKNYDNVLKELKSKNTNVSLDVDEPSKTKSATSDQNRQHRSAVDLNSTQTKESTKTKNKSSLNINDLSLNLSTSKNERKNKTSTKDDIAYAGGNLTLNLNEKSKNMDKQSIVDQLNLTQVKNESTKSAAKSKTKPKKKRKESYDMDSSDSIDLKLLLSEDSVNSIDFNKDKEMADNKLDEFIPLKKSVAKTNIRENEDIEDNQEEEMPFFIDTVGDSSMREENNVKAQKCDSSSAHSDDGPPLEVSYKKNNLNETANTSKNLNSSNIIESESDKNKKKSLNKSNLSETQPTESVETPNKCLISKTPKSESKEKNKSVLESHKTFISTETQPNTDDVANHSILKTPKSDKKKKKNNSISEAQNELTETKLADYENTNKSLISKTLKSEKKNKQASKDAINNSVTSKTKSDKNKSVLSESLHMSILTDLVVDSDETNNKSLTTKTPKSAKKNKSISHLDEPEMTTAKVIDKPLSPTSKGKKKNNLSQSLNYSILPYIEINDSEDDIPKETTKTSAKKNKHSKPLHSSMVENITHESLNQSTNKSPKKKRHIETEDEKQKGSENLSNKDSIIADEGEQDNVGIKKRKRKHSGTPALEVSLAGETSNESITRQSKKLRVSQNSLETNKTGTQETEELGSDKLSQNTSISSKKKVKKSTEAGSCQLHGKKEILISEIHFAGQNENKENGNENTHDIEIDSQASVSENTKTKAGKSKKRKNREDDDGRHKEAKVLKENSLDQIHIPRLPPSVLNELGDKPKRKAPVKQKKAISTTKFRVETAITERNKPSNYLEESIYIKDGDEHGARNKPKRVIKKPQVLPFVPTAAISNSGFTTNFKVNVIPQEIKFLAQSSNVSNFKNDYLYRKKYNIRSSFKKNGNIKMSKF